MSGFYPERAYGGKYLQADPERETRLRDAAPELLELVKRVAPLMNRLTLRGGVENADDYIAFGRDANALVARIEGEESNTPPCPPPPPNPLPSPSSSSRPRS